MIHDLKKEILFSLELRENEVAGEIKGDAVNSLAN